MIATEAFDLGVLTSVQQIVFKARLRGEKLEAIANDLGISVQTVATHERRAWAKLGFQPPRRLRGGKRSYDV